VPAGFQSFLQLEQHGAPPTKPTGIKPQEDRLLMREISEA